MKRTFVVTALLGLAAVPLLGAKPVSVRGTYVEARTAEVFAGGCVMNGEAGTTGRQALLAWKVDQGRFEGVALNGLSIVAAVSADVNLGIHEIGGESPTTRTALFVDERATPAQQKALVAMAKQLSNGIVDAVVQVAPTAIQFVDDGTDIRVAAQPLRLTVAKMLNHDPTCGGKQWFHPLASVDAAEMGTTAENAFTGAALGTRWSDPGKHSSFFGTFSVPEPRRPRSSSRGRAERTLARPRSFLPQYVTRTRYFSTAAPSCATGT